MISHAKVKIGTVADLCLGKMLDQKKNKGIYSKYLGNSNVRWGDFDLTELAEMKFLSEEKDRYGIKAGDLIICEGGEPGRCAIWTDEIPEMMIQKALHRVRGKSSLDNRFLYYWLLYANKNGMLEPYFTGTTIQHLTSKALAEIEIPLPPLEDQQKLINILEPLDKKIELNAAINQNLEAQAKAIFKSWFIDFEPFKDGEFVDSELGKIPKGWNIKYLGELCQSISETKKSNLDNLIFLNTGDVENGAVMHQHYSAMKEMPGQAKKSFQQNDILYSEIRPINKHFAFVYFNAEDYIASTKLMVIRAQGLSSIRLYHFLTLESVIEELQMEAESRSGTFPQIRFENIQKLPMLIASDDIEAKFCSTLESIFRKRTIIQEESVRLARLRDALLPKLMSGEIDVSEVAI